MRALTHKQKSVKAPKATFIFHQNDKVCVLAFFSFAKPSTMKNTFNWMDVHQ